MHFLVRAGLDRWWSSLGASLSCAVGSMLSERVGSMHARMHYVCMKSCPECSVRMLFLCRKVWERACVKWLVRKTDVRKTQGCRLHRQGSASMKRFAGLCFLLSHRWCSQCCSYHNYTLHCSHERGMAAPRGNVGTCNVSVSREWDRHSRSVDRSVCRSVGRCTWSRRPR